MVCDRVIVSMTSYPKRIANVAMSIFLLLTRQTRKPDEIHLWLSIEEFPNMEESLPEDLRAVLNHERVFMHWLLKNTFVHKRHEIFKIANYNDCVFLIDDDVRYDDNLINTVMGVHRLYPNCIVCYNDYNPHEYKGRHIRYNKNKLGPGPHINKIRWCGQSMIPAKLYPKDILDASHKDIRSKTSPVSDECWFQPWVVYNDIPIYYLSFGLSLFIGYIIDRILFVFLLFAKGLYKGDNTFDFVIKVLTTEFMAAIVACLVIILLYSIISAFSKKKRAA